tara:strand:- start:63 stop:305 length:243 start_codon:yes stop_codon:yes gene_type:complete
MKTDIQIQNEKLHSEMLTYHAQRNAESARAFELEKLLIQCLCYINEKGSFSLNGGFSPNMEDRETKLALDIRAAISAKSY